MSRTVIADLPLAPTPASTARPVHQKTAVRGERAGEGPSTPIPYSRRRPWRRYRRSTAPHRAGPTSRSTRRRPVDRLRTPKGPRRRNGGRETGWRTCAPHRRNEDRRRRGLLAAGRRPPEEQIGTSWHHRQGCRPIIGPGLRTGATLIHGIMYHYWITPFCPFAPQLGLTHLISLLLAVAVIAATCGFIASAVVRGTGDAHAGFSCWASSVD